jgi:methyl-accepting chemotaxis protein
MASDKVELSKKVDELSSQVVEFAENLTKFSRITNEKYEHFKKVRERTNKNSETIFDLIDMLKGHGLKLRDVESELTDINETVDERFEKVTEKLKTLSKNDKQILKVLEGNSGNIEKLFNKIKGKGKDDLKSDQNVDLKDIENEFKSVSKTLEDFINPHLTNVKSMTYVPPGSVELSSKYTTDFKVLSEILNSLLVISKANSDNIKAVKESVYKLSSDIDKSKNTILDTNKTLKYEIPRDDIYRYFEFDKTWENLPEVKKSPIRVKDDIKFTTRKVNKKFFEERGAEIIDAF